MKKLSLYTLTLIALSITNSIFTYHHHIKKSDENVVYFMADAPFGGKQAKGIYFRKQQQAIIIHGTTTYSFKETITNKTNPQLPAKKHLNPDLIKIGLFSNSTNRAGMPVITYLFGVLNKTAPLADIAIGSDLSHYTTKQFTPAEVFAGQGLIGTYFPLLKIASIYDLSGNNTTSYHFKNTQHGDITAPAGLQLIGSYDSSPQCDGQVCAISSMHTNIYGQQVPDMKVME
jgi:hypothetical protein